MNTIRHNWTNWEINTNVENNYNYPFTHKNSNRLFIFNQTLDCVHACVCECLCTCVCVNMC